MARQTHRTMRKLLIILMLGALVLAACTRSATTETLPEEPVEGGEQPPPTVDQDATMSALLSEGQTATAAAEQEGIGGGGETPEPTEDTTGGQVGEVQEPTEAPAEATPVPEETQPAAGPTTYVVQSGDWIYQIARNFGVDPQAIIDANPGIDPNNIQPGQELTIPAPGEPAPGSPTTGQTTYVVQPGDNLFRIALQYGMTFDAIAAANGIPAPYTVFPGQVLTIPAQ